MHLITNDEGSASRPQGQLEKKLEKYQGNLKYFSSELDSIFVQICQANNNRSSKGPKPKSIDVAFFPNVLDTQREPSQYLQKRDMPKKVILQIPPVERFENTIS